MDYQNHLSQCEGAVKRFAKNHKQNRHKRHLEAKFTNKVENMIESRLAVVELVDDSVLIRHKIPLSELSIVGFNKLDVAHNLRNPTSRNIFMNVFLSLKHTPSTS